MEKKKIHLTIDGHAICVERGDNSYGSRRTNGYPYPQVMSY